MGPGFLPSHTLQSVRTPAPGITLGSLSLLVHTFLVQMSGLLGGHTQPPPTQMEPVHEGNEVIMSQRQKMVSMVGNTPSLQICQRGKVRGTVALEGLRGSPPLHVTPHAPQLLSSTKMLRHTPCNDTASVAPLCIGSPTWLAGEGPLQRPDHSHTHACVHGRCVADTRMGVHNKQLSHRSCMARVHHKPIMQTLNFMFFSRSAADLTLHRIWSMPQPSSPPTHRPSTHAPDGQMFPLQQGSFKS